MSKNQLTAIININLEIPTGETSEKKAKEFAENYELPNGYISNSFEIVKFVKENLPTKQEVIDYMELHNADEVGIDDPWDYKEAEYNLLLSDKYND